jgi:hypothetical protein
MKSKLTLKSFRELAAFTVGVGECKRSAFATPSVEVSAEKHSHLPLVHSMALIKTTAGQWLPVRMSSNFPISNNNS